MNDRWPSFRDPLFTLAGGAVSLASLATGAAIVVLAFLFTTAATRGLSALLRRRGLEAGVSFGIVKILRYTMLVTGVFVAASSVGVRLDAILAASAALAVGIGFGLQNVAQNFISGIILLVEQPVRKGDFVRVADAFGVVEDVGLRATRVLTRDEVSIIVPNSQFITQAVINYTRPTTRLRIQVAVGVAYGTDTARASEILVAAATGVDGVMGTPAPEVRLEGFGASSLDLVMLVWIENAMDDRRIASELRFAVDRAFRENGVTIPFPQRDIHIVSGAVPTAPVSECL